MNTSGIIARSYETLALTPGASVFEAKQAYRRLAKTWHPDRFVYESDTRRREAEEKMKVINDAYKTILTDIPLLPARRMHRTSDSPHRQTAYQTQGRSGSRQMGIQAQIRAKERAEARKTFFIMSFLMAGGFTFFTVSSLLIWWLLPYAMYVVYG